MDTFFPYIYFSSNNNFRNHFIVYTYVHLQYIQTERIRSRNISILNYSFKTLNDGRPSANAYDPLSVEL